MAHIVVNAAAEKVFAAISDLTRHAEWATHPITIEAVEEGPVHVGSTYMATHKGKPGDRLYVTELLPNQRFGFRSVMPNKMEFNFTMTVGPQGDGALVTRSGRPTKLPGATKLVLLIFPLILIIANAAEKKFLQKMKASLEPAEEAIARNKEAANAGSPETEASPETHVVGPVTVEGSRLHIQDAEMEVGEYYLVPQKNRILAIRKTPQGKVEIYRLPR